MKYLLIILLLTACGGGGYTTNSNYGRDSDHGSRGNWRKYVPQNDPEPAFYRDTKTGNSYMQFDEGWYIDAQGNSIRKFGQDTYIDNQGNMYLPFGDGYINPYGNTLMPQ